MTTNSSQPTTSSPPQSPLTALPEQQTTQPRPKKGSQKKRKTRAQNNNVKRRRFSKEESLTIAKCWNYHDGNWESFYRDSKVKTLHATSVHLKNHVEYLKTKKNREISGTEGNEEREKILDNLANVAFEVDDVVENEDVADPGARDEIRGTGRTPQTPTLTDERFQLIHDVDKTSQSSCVDSTSISNGQDYEVERENVTERQSVRNRRIRTKEQERRGIVEEVRHQRKVNEESSETRNHILLLMLQQRQQQSQMIMAVMMKAMGVNFSDTPPKDPSSS